MQPASSDARTEKLLTAQQRRSQSTTESTSCRAYCKDRSGPFGTPPFISASLASLLTQPRRGASVTLAGQPAHHLSDLYETPTMFKTSASPAAIVGSSNLFRAGIFAAILSRPAASNAPPCCRSTLRWTERTQADRDRISKHDSPQTRHTAYPSMALSSSRDDL